MFIFQFLNDKIYNYVLFDIIVDFAFKNWKIDTLPSKWENLALLSLYTFWGKCVYHSKIYNYVKQNIIVNFIIQKLKNEYTFLKKYTKGDKNQIFRTLVAFLGEHFLVVSTPMENSEASA